VNYAVFGLGTGNGVVFIAAPIAGWTIGKNAQYVLNYYRTRKNATIERLKKS